MDGLSLWSFLVTLLLCQGPHEKPRVTIINQSSHTHTQERSEEMFGLAISLGRSDSVLIESLTGV